VVNKTDAVIDFQREAIRPPWSAPKYAITPLTTSPSEKTAGRSQTKATSTSATRATASSVAASL